MLGDGADKSKKLLIERRPHRPKMWKNTPTSSPLGSRVVPIEETRLADGEVVAKVESIEEENKGLQAKVSGLMLALQGAETELAEAKNNVRVETEEVLPEKLVIKTVKNATMEKGTILVKGVTAMDGEDYDIEVAVKRAPLKKFFGQPSKKGKTK